MAQGVQKNGQRYTAGLEKSEEATSQHDDTAPTTETIPSIIEPTANAPIDADIPPDGGYAWVVCGAISMINGFTWGIAASYGVYISQYLATDYFPGATPLDYALIGGLEFGVAMVISPICTILTRDVGRFWIMSAGCVMFAGGYIAASFAKEIWQLYLTQGVLVGLGLGCVFIPSVQVLPQ